MSTENQGVGTTPAPDAKPAAKAFDFADFDLGANAERGAVMDLRSPLNGNPVGVRFHTVGADSATYRRNLRAIQDKASMYPEREPTDSDTVLLLGRARNAAAALTGWESHTHGDCVSVNGDAMPFSIDNAVELLTKYFWAADQLLGFINTRGNYSAA